MTVFGAPKGISRIEGGTESQETMVSLGEYGEIHQVTADTMGDVRNDAMSVL